MGSWRRARESGTAEQSAPYATVCEIDIQCYNSSGKIHRKVGSVVALGEGNEWLAAKVSYLSLLYYIFGL